MTKELSSAESQEFEGNVFKYFEIGQVARYGAIIDRNAISDLPTRGRLLVEANAVVFAKTNSSRGTTAIIPESLDGALVSTGFIAIRTGSPEESLLWWSVLSSEAVRKQVYYPAVSASQPEIRPEIFGEARMLPHPTPAYRDELMKDAETMRESQIQIYQNLESIRAQQEALLSIGP
jgi:type I restriction enzyme M protein